jgi:hypothetical protein
VERQFLLEDGANVRRRGVGIHTPFPNPRRDTPRPLQRPTRPSADFVVGRIKHREFVVFDITHFEIPNALRTFSDARLHEVMKRYLITGASRGIGRAIAQKIASKETSLLLARARSRGARGS